MGGLGGLWDGVTALVDVIQTSPGYEILTFFLGCVLAWSATAKLASPGRAALALVDFQLMRHPVKAAALALGVFELVLAAGLLLGIHTHAVLLTAVVLFAVATALVARAAGQPESFACFCFGSDEEISRATVVRNVGLLVIAALLVTAGNTDVSRFASASDLLLTAGAAVSLLFGLVLLARVPNLLQWNWEVRDYYRRRAMECQT